jgi:hypothetical protein
VYNRDVSEVSPNVVAAEPPAPYRERPVSELGRALRRLSDQIAVSGEKPVSLDDVQRAGREMSPVE